MRKPFSFLYLLLVALLTVLTLAASTPPAIEVEAGGNEVTFSGPNANSVLKQAADYTAKHPGPVASMTYTVHPSELVSLTLTFPGK